MASGFSTYLDNGLLNAVFSGVAYTSPSKYYALFTGDAGLSADAPTKEVTGGGYARVAAAHSTFTAAANSMVTNKSEVTFPVAAEGWGTITHVALMDALTHGHVLAYAQIMSPNGSQPMPKIVNAADQFIIRVSGVKFGMEDKA